MANRSTARTSEKKQEDALRPGHLAVLIKRHVKGGTAADTAYAVLREAILRGILPPGFRLRADDLAAELDVSKTPVREALRKLQAEDLIESAGSTLIVKVLSEKQLIEIYYTREALEGMAARLAAENARPLDLSALRSIFHDLEAAHACSNGADVRRFTGEFQLAAFSASHNDYIYNLLSLMQEKIRNHPMTTTVLPGRDDEIVHYCRDLLEAIESRNADEAERIARFNRRRTLELRLKMLRTSMATNS